MQPGSIDSYALALGYVHHGECHDHRHLQVHDLRTEEEIPFQVGGIGDNDNEIRAFSICLVQQYLIGYLFVGAFWVKAIGARQVN